MKPKDWPADPGPLFAPAIVDERGVYIVGCATAVAVFRVFGQSIPWFTIKANAKITGYAASSSTLYVQDGPVVAAWDLTYGGCIGGFNIVTGQKWKPPASEHEWVIATPPASLFDVPAGAANDAVEFSPPAVRESQLQGDLLGQVFVLGSDGSLHCFDDGLANKYGRPVKLAAPLRLELVMGEMPQPSGDVLCHLYYIDKSGAIVAINGSVMPPAEIPGWPAKGTLAPAKALPLRFVDGLLWGGGVAGADFFALPPDPKQGPRVTVANANGWRAYDLETDERLAVVTDGNHSRLIAYGEGVKKSDRWRDRATAAAGQSRFWSGVGSGATRGPALVLEIDEGISEAVPFRVVLANTVDAVNPAWTPDYPPGSTQLDAAVMESGTLRSILPKIALVRSQAIVARHVLYCMVRGAAAGPDWLAIFALAPERTSVLANANTALADLRMRAKPIRVQLVKVIVYHIRPDGRIQRDDPKIAKNISARLTIRGFPDVDVRTDGDGWMFLDPKYNGAVIALTNSTAPWSGDGAFEVGPGVITLDWNRNDAQLWNDVHVWTGWGADEPVDATQGAAK